MDGKTGTFFSRDWKHKFSKTRSPTLGLNRLRKLISKWNGQAKVAIIYELENRTEIERYYKGIKHEKQDATNQTINKKENEHT